MHEPSEGTVSSEGGGGGEEKRIRGDGVRGSSGRLRHNGSRG